ncbi:unnamed protein product [Nippostrongylus brasiliensis]|uniref:Ring_hydroxyl_A domain-containing protein n=1 Tax=Nippostrongylus brasiliensis TaxID=27835 RepID=A0A0N4XIH5_NIPBR|nr:unnamed protein product [Nippostrongylus brasiliensis]
MVEVMETSADDDEQEILLMPAWKQLDGQEIFYVIHPNRAVTREVFIDGVKQGARYAGEFTPVDYKPWLVFVNYLPMEDTSLLEGLRCTQPAHRGHSPQFGFLPEDYAGGYLRKNWELLQTKLTNLVNQMEQK